MRQTRRAAVIMATARFAVAPIHPFSGDLSGVNVTFRFGLIALFVFSLCFLVPGPSHAGLSYGPPAPFCVIYSGGTGWCQGTIAGFKADPDPNTYASVTTSVMGNSLYFFANYRGTRASCLVPWSWTNQVTQILRLSQHRGPFTVYFDQYGYCTDIAIYQASYYEQ